jgi:hypothetical protein
MKPNQRKAKEKKNAKNSDPTYLETPTKEKKHKKNKKDPFPT